MAERKIYSSTNDNWSVQTDREDRTLTPRFGWCCAASALWCDSRLKGVGPAFTKPDELRSGLLQVKYRWGRADEEASVEYLLKEIGRKAVLGIEGQVVDAFLEVISNSPGVLLIQTHGDMHHAMAVDTRGSELYFYDIEEGLYSYDTRRDFREGVRSRYPSRSNTWDAFIVT